MFSFPLSLHSLRTQSKIKQCVLSHVCYLFINVCFEWAIPGLFFFILVFPTVSSKNVHSKKNSMTGFELRISCIESERSVNWATTTLSMCLCLFMILFNSSFFTFFFHCFPPVLHCFQIWLWQGGIIHYPKIQQRCIRYLKAIKLQITNWRVLSGAA